MLTVHISRRIKGRLSAKPSKTCPKPPTLRGSNISDAAAVQADAPPTRVSSHVLPVIRRKLTGTPYAIRNGGRRSAAIQIYWLLSNCPTIHGH